MLFVVVGCLHAGKSLSLWPICSWSVYDHSGRDRLPEVTTRLELQLVDREGRAHVFTPTDLLLVEGEDVARDIIRATVDVRAGRTSGLSSIAGPEGASGGTRGR